MMAMTRHRVAVGQTEDEMCQQLREDSPVVDSCEGERVVRLMWLLVSCRCGEVVSSLLRHRYLGILRFSITCSVVAIAQLRLG